MEERETTSHLKGKLHCFYIPYTICVTFYLEERGKEQV